MTPLPLKMYRFRDATDVKYYFQRELDRFPRVDGRRMFAEFGAFLLRPKGEPKNRLTHIVFPETILALPEAGRGFRGYSASSFPQVILLADADSHALYAQVIADRSTVDGLPERLATMVPMDKACTNADLWTFVSDEDRSTLAASGFGPKMSPREWGEAINERQRAVNPTTYATTKNGDFMHARTLPFSINRRGSIGFSGSFLHMPEFITDVIAENRFVYPGLAVSDNKDETPYEIGGAHIHPRRKRLDQLEIELAEKIGDHVVRRTPSVPDIAYQRSTRALFGDLSTVFLGRRTNTMETFQIILETDEDGEVSGLRAFDFGDADTEKLRTLNDLALKALRSASPDLAIVIDHYHYLDSLTKSNFGAPGASDHVGDPDYDRSRETVAPTGG